MGNGSIASRLLAALVASCGLLSLVAAGGGWSCDGAEFWVTRYYADCAEWGGQLGALTELLATHYYGRWDRL